MGKIAKALKAAIRGGVNRVGYDIGRYDIHNFRWHLAHLLDVRRIATVLDVGANEGQFGASLRGLGFGGRIVSFEPLAGAWQKLRQRADADPGWTVVNIGLGDRNEERTIHVSANSQSSSFLPMLAAHEQAAPESRYQEHQSAIIRRLDDVFADYCKPGERVFLKIDTQGYERHVMEGGRAVLAGIPLVQLECSLVPLYQGGLLIEEAVAWMRALGYDPVDFAPGFRQPETGDLLQLDALFAARSG